jgi:putative Mg2+ transporter-C (MgtC) family protein
LSTGSTPASTGRPEPWVGNLVLILLSLILRAFFSGVIGFEREYHGHAAGLRTHLLVAVGSALIMIISIYGFPTVIEGQTL